MNDPLLSYFRQPSTERFTQLVASEQAAVFGAAWRVLGDRAAAEDVTQELFMKVLDADWGKREIRVGRGFLVSQTIGLARTKLRGERRRSEREAAAASMEQVEDDAVSGAVLSEVRDAILELPEGPRECVELRYFGGLKASEIAERLGCALRTVNERLQAGRERLRGRLSANSMLFVLPLLESDAPPPTVAVSSELSKALTKAAEQSLSATSAGSLGVLSYAVGGSLLAVLIVIGAITRSGEAQTANENENAVVDVESPNAAGLKVDSGNSETLASNRRLDSGQARRAASNAAGVSVAPAVARFHVRVRDELGAPVQGATLHIHARKLATLRAVMKLEESQVSPEIAGLLDPVELAGTDEFSVDEVPAALCNLTFEIGALAPGYASATPQNFSIAPSGKTEIELVLPKPRRAQLMILDEESSEPVVGATVFSVTELERRDLDPKLVWRESGVARGTSDSSGATLLDELGSGAHQLEIVASGYQLVVLHDQALEGLIEVRLSPVEATGTIRVRVQDPAGDPIEGVPVLLTPVAAESELRVMTDATGVARFESLGADSYNASLAIMEFAVLARDNGYGRSSATLKSFESASIEAGEIVELTLGYLRGSATWEVLVRTASGEPAAGEKVTIAGVLQLSLETDENGRCRFVNLPEGSWRLSVGEFFESIEYQEQALASHETRLDQIDLGGAKVEGQVVIAETGVKPPRAFLTLRGEVTTSTHALREGRFTFERIPPGEYTLFGTVPGFATTRQRVQVGEGDRDVEVRLVRGGSVVVERTEAWFALGSELQLLGGEDGPFSPRGNQTGQHRVEYERLFPGTYTLRASAPEREPVERRIEVRDGRESVIILD